MKKLITMAAIVAACNSAHAWFFFIPFGMFQNSDKVAVEKYEKEGDWASMLYLANKRLEVDAKNPSWHYLAGLSYQRTSRFTEAIQSYTRAIDLKDGNYPAAEGNRKICMDQVSRLAEKSSAPIAPAVLQPVVAKPDESLAERLRELKRLRDENLITQEVYEAKQKEVMQLR